jgi:hypothetical protein
VDFIDVKDVDVKACVKDRWWGHLRTLGDTWSQLYMFQDSWWGPCFAN